MECPEPSALLACVEGRASETQQAELRAHLERCDACRQVVLALEDVAAPTLPQDADAKAASVPRGQLVGRYVMIHQLGAGGMGVVYAAYDPELDRKVALKLIRSELDGNAAANELKDRLRREAQAMARVAHPNVATVHDVGREGEQVFVAMEFIDGETLQQWLSKGPRSRAAILDVFARAGRGLAAAHAAGLVHRDFKPNNVMIDRDGRVRVMDFGLARASGVASGDVRPSSPSRIDSPLTATGVLLGTPAYMAPEQLGRGTVDARTDQFSFCVALYEALAGARPFVAADTDELRAAILASRLARPKRRMPGWLLAVVERGLKPKPEERWPSMDALLGALKRDPWRRRLRALATVGMAGLIAAGVVAVRRATSARAELCSGAERKLAGIWDADRRRAVEEAFANTGVAYAPITFASVAARFDEYGAAWVVARTDACQATRIRGEQSEDLLDARMACLDDRLGQLASLAELFGHADASVVAKAASAVGELPSMRGCADLEALRQLVPPPRDPAARAKVEALMKRKNQVEALYDAGQYRAALPLAESLLKDASTVDYAPLQGEAGYQLGRLYLRLTRLAEAARVSETAALAFEAGRDDESAARAWGLLGYIAGYEQSQPNEGFHYLRLAQAELDRRGSKSEEAEQLLASRRLAVLLTAGRYEESRAEAQRSLTLARKLTPTGSVAIIEALSSLAVILDMQGRAPEAVPLGHEALARAEKELGVVHPTTMLVLTNLVSALCGAGRFAEALPLAVSELERAERGPSPDPREVAIALVGRARALTGLGRYQGAIADNRRALALYATIAADGDLTPTDKLAIADPLTDLGRDERLLDRPSDAIAPLERAIATHEAQESPPADIAGARFELARALWETGDRGRARKLAETSYAAWAEQARRLGGSFAQRADEARDWLAKHR
jgi:tetratricopeptide (TPR) repeat protein